MGRHGSNLFTHLPSPPPPLPPFLFPPLPPFLSPLPQSSPPGHRVVIHCRSMPHPRLHHLPTHNGQGTIVPLLPRQKIDSLLPAPSPGLLRAAPRGYRECSRVTRLPNILGLAKLYGSRHGNFDRGGNSSLPNKVVHIKYATKGELHFLCAFQHTADVCEVIPTKAYNRRYRTTQCTSSPAYGARGL